MTSRTETRWILAFDASCGTCSEIAQAAARTAGSKLEVLSLADLDVRRWRTQALGADAPPAPTLLRVRSDRADAWTGPGMGLRLLGRLGPRATVRLLGALADIGSVRPRSAGGPTIGRKRFLRLGAGVGIAAGLVLAGKAPSLAADGDQVRAWVRANKHQLPQRYSEFVEFSPVYRRAIYVELEPRVMSRLWTEHLAEYRRTHGNLSDAQNQVLTDATALASDESTFAREVTEMHGRVQELANAAVEAFGREEARKIGTVLGPSEADGTPREACHCNLDDDWCSAYCADYTCEYSEKGCGWYHMYPCNGKCACC